MLKQAHLGREWWSYACQFAGHMMREKFLGRERPHPLFGQLVGIWKSHDKAQAKSWRTIQDEFGKFKWVDHAGRIYQGTPFSIEPDATSKHIFVASMIHTSMRSPVLRDRWNILGGEPSPGGAWPSITPAGAQTVLA